MEAYISSRHQPTAKPQLLGGNAKTGFGLAHISYYYRSSTTAGIPNYLRRSVIMNTNIIILICYSLFFHTLLVYSQTCPDNFNMVTNAAGAASCYRAEQTPTTATAARRICEEQGGALASIVDATENNFVTQLTQVDSFIGLNDRDNERGADSSDWVWDDGRSYSFMNFASGQPDGAADLDCVYAALTSGEWSTANCDDNVQMGFVCRTEPTSTQKICLYGEDHVTRSDGENKLVKDLVNGDKVLSISEEGDVIEDEVYMVGHASPNLGAAFIKITTQDGTVHATGKHNLATVAGDKAASSITTSDHLFLYKNGSVSTSAVTAVSALRLTGVYSPVTRRGRLLVNGLLASSYTDHIGGAGAAPVTHTALWPLRVAHLYLPTITDFQYSSEGTPPWWPVVAAFSDVVMGK